MAADLPTTRFRSRHTLRHLLPWALALAVATCTQDRFEPSGGGVGYLSFRPVYGIGGSLSQFGVVADSIHVRVTRPVAQLVLDTTVFFPPDSSRVQLALPLQLVQSPETLFAVIEISSGGTVLFTDSLAVEVKDGPPGSTPPPVATFTYVGPGANLAAITILPGDTTVALGDTLFFTATAVDSGGQPLAAFYTGWKTSDTAVARINAQGRLVAPNARGSVRVIGFTPTGPADTTLVTFAPVPTQILADSGDAQSGLAGDSLAQLFVAQVRAADALGVPGIAVRFAAASGGGGVRDTLLFTDSTGRVATRGVLGTAAGAGTWTATVAGTALSATFNATALAGAPTAIAIQAGNAQTDTAGRALGVPFTVRVADGFDNPVAGAMVHWTRLTGTGTLAADSTATDASGVASVGYTLGSIGTDSVRALLGGTSAFVDFAVTAVNGAPAAVAKLLGDAQADTVGRTPADPLVVRVQDAAANPVVGVPVVWTVLRGGLVAPDTSFTDSTGRAAASYTLGTAAGTDSVRAQAGGASAIFTFGALAGQATTLAAASGDAQTDTVRRTLPLPFVVTAADTFGNPVAGATVAFARTAGTGTLLSDTLLTDALGHAAAGYILGGLPGTDSVVATLAGTAQTVTFTATAVQALPASISTASGNGQAAAAGTAFATPLTVQVLDGNDDPIVGDTVTWTVTSGTGSLSAPTAVTDSAGNASITVTAGDTAGTLTVRALAAGLVTPADFTLTITAAAPSVIAIVSGDDQTDTTGRALAAPLVAGVTDAFGNPVAGATVYFTRIAGAGSVAPDSALTDALGHAAATYTLGATPGADTVRATLGGTAAFVDFAATTISGAPAGLAILLGNGQGDTVLSTLPDSLVVRLTDGGGTPIPGATLHWVAAGVTLSDTLTVTDAGGRAAVRATLDSVALQAVVGVWNDDSTVAAAFTLTARAGAPAQLSILSGDGQSGQVSTALTQPLVVFAQDAYGNPADSARVSFVRTAGTGAVVPDTAIADSLGLAQASYTLGAVAGTDSVIAKLVDGPASVIFTATATAGAASALVYVDGTGQSDTVAAALPAPFRVEVRDASSNPVPGAWVRFTALNGGTLLADSVQTDGAGVAAVNYTLGTAAGQDTVLATMATLPADTILFYAAVQAGAPFLFTAVSGDSQSAAVGTALPAPFVVRLTDQFSNPLAGVAVAFDTLTGGGSLLAPAPTTDAAGLASSDTVTLGGTAGTAVFIATTAALPGDTVRFSATVLPIGTSAQWTGALSTDFGTAGNWSPAAVPTSVDNVFIPAAAANQPVLDAARTIGGLAVESGAALALGANSLTLVGDAAVDGSVSRTTGQLVLNPSAGTARGNLAGARVTGTVTLSGATVVADSLQVSAGALVVGGQVLTVNGPLSVTGGGAFTMQNPADSVTVTGPALFNGSTNTGLLTAGTLVLLGDLSQPSGSPTLRASGTHRTILAGSAPQTVTFAAAGLGSNQLQDVTFANPSGITLGGNFAAGGAVAITAGGVSGTGRTAFLGGSLDDPTSTAWDVTTTTLAGSPSLLPDSLLHDLVVTGTVTLGRALVVHGNYAQSTGTFALGGYPMRVDGGATLSGGAQFLMQNAGDTLDVAGPVSWAGSTNTGLLTAGVLVLRGDFTETSGSPVFRAGGTHKTLFAGSAPQTATFGAPGLGSNQFQDVEFANAAGVTLASNAAAGGTVAVTAGQVTGAGRTVTVAGDVVDATGVSWQPDVTVLAGAPAALPDSFARSVSVTGTVTLAKALVIHGALGGSAGTLTLGGHALRVDSTLTVTGTHQLMMQDAADTLDVGGAVSWAGSTNTGLLTAGTLILRGDFSEPSGSPVFRASGTHRTVFAGAAAQAVSIGAPAIGGNQFQDVDFANAAGVTLTSNVAVGGSVAVLAGTVDGATSTVTVAGNVTDATGAAWRPGTTALTGTPTALPDSFARNLVVGGTVTLGKPLVVKAGLTANAGALALNGFRLRVDSALTVTGTAQVLMQNAADTLDVAGPVSWAGSTNTGLLTAGTLILRGDFSEPSGSPVFRAGGTHLTLFAGSAAQTASFGAPGIGGNQFQDVTFANPAGVSFTSGAAVAGNATVLAGGVTGATSTITVAGTVADSVPLGWAPATTILTGTPASLPDSFARNVQVTGTLTLTRPLAVRGSYTQGGGALTLGGSALRVDSNFTVTGGAQVLMQNAADSLDIGGAASWNGSTAAGLLTAGTLVLRGDFSEASGSSVFQPSGAHRTVFAGTAPHLVSFGAPGFAANRFHHLTLAGTGAVTLAGDAFATGTLTKAAGAAATVTTNGALRTLAVRGLAVDGVVFDSVRVTSSGAATTTFNNVTFQRQDPATVQLTLVEPGTPAPVTFTGVQFTTVPTTGRFVSAADTTADGNPLHILFAASLPLDGTAYEQEVAGGDGATLDWSALVFATPPSAVTQGDTITPAVRVAAVGPLGDTLTGFTGAITLALGADPGGATLSGTLTQNAVAGVATFGDLSLDNAGTGYTLVASSGGIAGATSAPFDVMVLLPAGFQTAWVGGTSADWNTATNWSGGAVPDSTTNAYIPSAGVVNPATVTTGVARVNRLLVAPGATLDVQSGATLAADSSVDAGTTITGLGTLALEGDGTLTGTASLPVTVDGSYTVAGSATTGALTLNGVLAVAADSLAVTGDLTTAGSGLLAMTDAAALVDVGGNALFGGGSTAGSLTLGTLRIAGDLSAFGGAPDAFAPAAGHLTLLNGSGVQTVSFSAPDSSAGSRFGRLQVNTAGTAFLLGRYDAMGDLLVAGGARLADSLGAGFEAHGFVTVDASGTLEVNSLRTRGGLGVAAGATYTVATTTYYGGGTFPINPAPYDTLVLELNGQATGDLAVTGDLRLTGAGAGFDPNGHTVAVGGNVAITNGATLTMQNAADVLNVAGSFFTNGDSTTGRLTNGLLQIAGGFHQSADGSGESFRASGSHVTRFTGGLGARAIAFDSPSTSASDLGGSHFAILDLPDGVDSVSGRVPAAVSVSVGGSVTYDTLGGGNELASYGTLDILASSDSIHLQGLETWGGLSKAGAGSYAVGTTRLYGGSGVLPALPYIDLILAYTASYTLGADQVIPGNLSLGIYCSEICTSQPGELAVGGHVLTVGADLGVLGLGQLTMGAGDSVDVTGTLTWRGAPNSGHLTGGTLVARGLFNEVGTDVFQADAAHRTVLLNPGVDDIYLASNSRFGKLYLLGGPRRIRTSAPLVVADSLVLGSSTAELSDTAFNFNSGQIVTQGPILTVNGSAIAMGGSMRIDVSAPQILGAYTVANTILGGAGQTVPNLTYGNGNIQVVGTALLGGALDLGSGNLTVDGSAGAADLDLNGQVAQVQNFATAGNGTLTSTTAGSGLVVRGDATFNGGDETGRLTEGGITLKGFFTQDTATSQASYYSSGNHTTVFADSNFGGSHATLATMYAGQSRFNDVAVYGRGVLFFGAAWVAGDLAILDAGVDSVGGGLANVAGALTDPNYAWKVDSTYLLGPNPTLPDSIDGTVVFAGNASLTNLLRVGGEVRIEDTLAVNGYTLLAHGGLTVAGPGVLQMTNPTDEVVVDGLADFAGAVPTALMTAGRLTLNGDLTVGATGAFDAGGTHRTVLGGSGTQTVTFSGGPQGYGFNDLVAYAPTLALGSAVVVHGTLADSLPATPFNVQGNGFALDARRAALQNAQFTDLLPTFGDSSQVDTVDIYHTDPTGRTQLTIRGAGRTTPLDLTQVTFHDIPATGLLLQVTDTVGSGDTLVVRMFGSTPFNGKGLTATSGLADAQWGSLALQSFPATVDSAVAFGFGVVVQEPDGSTRPDVVGSVDLTLAANPNGATLGGTTTATFDGAVANYSGLTLDRPGSGTSFLLQMQGRPVDSLITPALDVVNPAPAGAVIFDAGAGDGLWTSALNWSTDAVPTATDSVFIPAGTAVTFSGADTIGTLVLGSGADLTIASGTLVSTGNVFAGQTIAGAGTLEMAGSGVQLSGTFPSLRITGTATAVGPTTVTGDLFVNGAAAEFIVGGQKVTVNNQLWTQNGGLFTMTSPADTLTIDSGSFAGGDETGHLTDGVLFIKSAFDQLGGDPNAFHMSGNHTTVFPNTGSSAFADISAPGSSQFANLRIENPAGVGLNESGAGWIRVTGDFTLVNGGVATGDTVFVGGNATVTAPGDSLELVRLRVSGDLNVAGGYNVPTTELDGTGQTVAGTTGGYQALNVLGTASLGGAVVARSVTVAVGGSLDVGGHPLTVDSLFTNAGVGDLLMDNAADTVIVNTLAQFNGTSPATPMTAGTLEIRGDLAVSPNYDAFVATAGHVTRFAGAPVHLMDFPGEGNATPLGTVVIDSGTVFFNDNSLITGDLILHNGLLADSSQVAGVVVRGSVLADNGPSTELLLGRLTLQGALDWQGSGLNYHPAITEFAGAGQLIPQLTYTQVVVSGNATLGGDRAWDQGTVDSAGVLTLGGHRLDIASGGLLVTDSARLVMQSPGDTLWVLGTAIFSTDANTTGDYTAGVIRTPHFVQVQGSFGGTSSFVQMGSNRIVPQARDTIEFASAGPGVSGLRSIDFSSAGDSVFVSGLWASDSVRIADPATVVVATDGYPFHAAGALDLVDGTLTAARVTLGGTVSYAAGTYAVDTTVFVAEGQIIPATVPYRDIVVQYGATLGGNLALPGRSVRVENSGRLDLAGHTLDLSGISALGQFQTTGPGVLVMQSPADTLVAGNVEFRGGNTTGLLTAGLIRAANFTQAPDYDARSFSASGSHTVALVNLGPFSEAPFSLTIYGVMDDTTSHFNNVRFLATTGTTLDGNVYAADTAYLGNSLFGTGRTLTAAGPIIIDSAAAVELDTLRVLDTLTVDPSATYTVANTVFGPSASPIPAAVPYNSVFIEGSQTLTDTLTASGDITLRGSGTLTPAGNNVTASGGLHLADNSHLVMAAGDTVIVGDASFDGAASTTDLAGGILRIGGNFTQNNSTSSQSFAPSGTLTEFIGTGTHTVAFANPSVSLSRFADLSVLDGGTLQPTTGIYVTGATTIDTSSTFDGQFVTGSMTAEFLGKVHVLDLGIVQAFGNGLMLFHDSLQIDPTASYQAFNTAFQGTDGIPNANYTHMYLREGVHLTMTHPLYMTGGLFIQNDNITGNPADTVTIRLNGQKLGAFNFGITGYGRITMDNPADTLEIGQNATFGGLDQDTSLTAGVIRIGGYLQQAGTYSSRSFAPIGTLTEFYGSGNHNIDFANPGVSLSHLRDLAVAGTATFISTASVLGDVTVNTGATLTSSSPGANVFFFGKVNALGSGAITNPTTGLFTFNDSLTVSSPANYSVVNTAFQNTNAVPALTYTNLYLNDGVHDTLTADLTVNGTLSLSASTVGGQDLVLNGNTINALTFTTQNEGRLTMDNALDSLLVSQTATFGGGDLTGRLTAGALTVGGNFYQNGLSLTSFVADSGHTTQFAGTGTHQVYFSTPSAAGDGGSHFGSLSFATDAGLVLDVQSSMWAEGTLTTTGGSTPTLQNGTVPLQTLTARDVNIDGITFDHIQFHLEKSTGVASGAGNMSSVTFQNFATSEDQFLVDLPGESSQYAWSGFTFTQLNTGDTGRYLVASDTDGATPDALTISLGTNNWGVTDPPFYVGLNGAIVSPFAP